MGKAKTLPIIQVDLHTKIMSAEEPVYVLFPGEAYTLFNTIRDKSVLALDFPGLDFGGAERAADLRDLHQRIVMSTRLRNWHKAGPDRGPEPSRDLRDYARMSLTDARAIYVGAVTALYFDLKPGSIVVVPGPGHWGEVLVGEVVGGLTTVRDETNYPGEDIPARRVRWLARRPKTDFSEALIRRLPTPNPFTLLTREFREEVLTAAYENVVYGNRFVSKFLTTEHSFNALDAYRIQLFLNFASGAFIASEEGAEHEKFNLDVEKALEFLADNPDLIPELTLNINSPGFVKMLSEGLAPLVVAVCLALALAGCDDIKPEQIEVVNSTATTQVARDCSVQVAESVKDIFTFIDMDSWKVLCKSTQEAHADTGLTTAVTAKAKK